MKKKTLIVMLSCLIMFSGIIFGLQNVYVHDFTREICKEQFWTHGGDRAEYHAFIENLFEILNAGDDYQNLIVSDSFQYDVVVDYLEALRSNGSLESVENESIRFYTVEGFDVDNDKRMILKILYLIKGKDGSLTEYNDLIGIAQVDSEWKLWGILWKDTGFDVSDASLEQLDMPEKGEEICILHTTAGDIKFRLFGNLVPKTVKNFTELAKTGCYDGTIFDRTINDFVIQGGDFAGPGQSGDSIWGGRFDDEFSRDLYNFRGAVSMGNDGPNTNGTQFFIVQRRKAPEENFSSVMLPLNVEEKYREVGGTPHLDRRHTVFGQVFEGMDVVDAIAAYPVDENAMPYEPVVILSVEFITY